MNYNPKELKERAVKLGLPGGSYRALTIADKILALIENQQCDIITAVCALEEAEAGLMRMLPKRQAETKDQQNGTEHNRQT